MALDATVWRRAEELFHAALERPPDERPAFLDQSCGDDADLRRFVDKLLSRDQQHPSFLEHPLSTQPREELVGRQLGPYRIVSLLGAGGMGEVYCAHDEKLDRDVAIKMLPPGFARDPGRLARFRREARVLASLNHPNIAAIYGLEEFQDVEFLVLELVEGETLRGPLPFAAAVDCASQVAEALHAAHERGIVHRDLKPANLKVTPAGTVKVLDFGLAKAAADAEAAFDPRLAPPAACDGTATGQVLGTPGYMSPEQARGLPVDQRADVWAFGCLLYELLAGARAFDRATASDIAPLAPAQPDWDALPADVPPGIRALLRQCLEPDLACRLDDIANVRAALEEAWRPEPQRGRGTRARAIQSLAVLPLSNLAGDPEQEYFVDGMTEALIAELAQIRALRVISRTSAMHYRGSTKTVPEIARELGVEAVVEGSVMRAGERVRITAQLIDAVNDRHLWARSYERDLRDVLGLQSEVARAVADEIQVTLTPQERVRLARPRPVNVEAHEAYVRGRYHYGRVQPERSIDHFRRAIALDPDYALAHAGIADAHCMMFGSAMEVVPPSQVAPLARAAALRALELDESLAEPHVSLARVLFWHDRDRSGAERELRRAIELNPSCAMAHFHHGVLLADLRRTGESIDACQRGLRLDPVSIWNLSIIGAFLWELGQDEMGKQQVQKAIDLDSRFFFTWSVLSLFHTREGRFADAVATAEEGVRLSRGLPLALGWLGHALGKAGRRAEALAVLDQLEEARAHRHVPEMAKAWCCVGLGDHEGAIQALERGYEQRDSQLPHVDVFREFRPLDADPRFQNLRRRLGLAAAPPTTHH